MPNPGRSYDARSRPYVHRDSAKAFGGVVIGFIKDKSAIAIARLPGKERNFSGENFWARANTISTVGFNEDHINIYIRDQEDSDGSGRF